MKEKNKKVIVIVIIVLAIVCINLLYFLSRYYNKAQNYPYKGEGLEEAFLKEFPGDYSEVLRTEEQGVTVLLGYYSDRRGACYAYYEKAPFFDRWIKIQDGMMRMDKPSIMVQTDGFYHSNKMYLSLNLDGISEVVVIVGGKETAFDTNSEKPFVVITKDEFDSIVFFTEEGGEISEKEFLQ